MTRLDWAAGAIVLVAFAVVQLALLQGPNPHDPAIYFKAAINFPNVDAGVFVLRIGVVWPVVAALFVFGPSAAALYAVPVAAGLVLVAAVYGTMLLLSRDRVLAAAAALVTGANDYILLNSSFIFPDTIATAAFTAGFLCLVFGATRIRDDDRGAGWISALSAIGAGVFFGWAYLAREFSPILLPAVVVAVALLRYRVRHVAMLAGAAAVTFSVGPLYGLLHYGDPLARLRPLFERVDVPVEPGRLARMEHIQAQLTSPVDTVAVFPRLLLSWHVGWVFLLLLATFVIALVRLRDWRSWILGAWVVSLWTTMAVFGLVELPSGRWILNITNIRYWYPIFPPLVMGAFLGVGLLLGKSSTRRRRFSVVHIAAVGLAGLALLPGIVQFQRCAAKDIWKRDPRAGWQDLRSWFAASEAQRYDVVWTDRGSNRLIPAFTSTFFGRRLWDGNVRAFPRGGAAEVRTVARAPFVLVVNRARRRFDRDLSHLRSRWAPIFISENRRMLVLAPEPVSEGRAAAPASPWWSSLRSEGAAAEPGRCGLSPYEPA